jgi:hypothetical protein
VNAAANLGAIVCYGAAMRRSIAMIALVAGCSHATTTVPTKPPPDTSASVDSWLVAEPREPRAEGCAIETVAVGEADIAPGRRFGPGGEYEALGFVQVHLPPRPRRAGAGDTVGSVSSGPSASDIPEALSLAQPRACRMGGDALSQVSYDEQLSESAVTISILYEVWAHAAPPSNSAG